MPITLNGSAGVTGATQYGPIAVNTSAPNGSVNVDAAGNVGIGTSSPGQRLTLGPLGVFRLQTGAVAMDCTPTPGATDGFVWNTSLSSYYAWSIAGSERARIDSSGNLLVGTTSNPNAFKFLVNGNARFEGYTGGDYQLASVPSGGADRQVFIAGVLGVSNGFTVRYISGAMQYTMTGLANGTVSSSGGVLSASSDQNMKVADGAVTSALDKVKQLQPRYFYWKGQDGSADSEAGRQLGFYAQEVHAVIPEAAPEPKQEHEGWGIYDRALVATLTAAIQELKAIVDSQAVEIAALKGSK